MSISQSSIQTACPLAKERYAALGVNAETALERLEKVTIRLHCRTLSSHRNHCR